VFDTGQPSLYDSDATPQLVVSSNAYGTPMGAGAAIADPACRPVPVGQTGGKSDSAAEEASWRTRALGASEAPKLDWREQAGLSLDSRPAWLREEEVTLQSKPLYLKNESKEVKRVVTFDEPAPQDNEDEEAFRGNNETQTEPVKEKTGCLGCLPIGRRNKNGLSKDCTKKVQEIFKCLDSNGDGSITREEASMFFKGKFGKLSVNAMFNETDVDASDNITIKEFVGFWEQVKASGYADEDIISELEIIGEGGAWVDFKDQRSVVAN